MTYEKSKSGAVASDKPSLVIDGVVKINFIKNIWRTSVLFVGLVIPLFRTSCVSKPEGVPDSVNFGCFVSSRCERLHCNAM